MTGNKILVTPRSITRDGHPALQRLEAAGYEVILSTPGQQPDEQELLRLLPGCIGYLAGVEPVGVKVLEAATELRAISRNGTGVNNIDLEAAERLRVRILRAAGANARGVAELAIGLMLALVRSIPFSDRHLKAARWERRKGLELRGRTLGLVGCGHVGLEVARMASAFGMHVTAYDPYPAAGISLPDHFSFGSEVQVFTQADVLSLHCPVPEDGRPLIDRQRIKSMKTGVYLINTARGDLLDDQAVLEALEAGKIAGVALDAFRAEPPGEDALVHHDKTIAVPHIGGFTEESVTRAVDAAVDNLLEALQSNCDR